MADRVALLFSELLKLPVEEIDETTSPENTPQWDSLQAINLVIALEEEFGVRLGTKEIMSMRSVGVVKNVLRSKGVSDI